MDQPIAFFESLGEPEQAQQWYERPAEVALAEAVMDKRRLQAAIKLLEDRIDELEAEVLGKWRADGIASMKVQTENGAATLYMSTTVWGKTEPLIAVDTEAIRAQWPELETVNWTKTAALLRSVLADGDKEALERLAQAGIFPDERTKINVKKG